MADGPSGGDGMGSSKILLDRISEIRAERNPERRLKMLQELNESLPSGIKVEMPSLVTNAYVRKALDILEERLNSSSAND